MPAMPRSRPLNLPIRTIHTRGQTMWAFLWACVALIELGVILYLSKKGAIDRQKADSALSDALTWAREEINRLKGAK